jgi:hypothetical protein
MKTLKLLPLFPILLCFAASVSQTAYAQTIPHDPAQGGITGRLVEGKRLAPVTLTQFTITGAPLIQDVQVHYLAITNPTDTDTAIWVEDSNGDSLALLGGNTITAHHTFIVPLPTTGLHFDNGVFIKSGNGLVVVWMKAWTRK